MYLLFLASVHGFMHETSDFLLNNNLFIYQVLCTLIYRRRSLYSFLWNEVHMQKVNLCRISRGKICVVWQPIIKSKFPLSSHLILMMFASLHIFIFTSAWLILTSNETTGQRIISADTTAAFDYVANSSLGLRSNHPSQHSKQMSVISTTTTGLR